MEQIQKFINFQASAIHGTDPKALVTVGSWSEYASTDKQLENGRKFFNYYTDECLIKAGMESDGTLDYNQMHTYWTNKGSPFMTKASEYALGKPIVIGEFSSKKSSPLKDIAAEYKYAYDNEYAGAWDWSFTAADGNDDLSKCREGMTAIKDLANTQVDILGGATPAKDTCNVSCSDTAPTGSYTCKQ